MLLGATARKCGELGVGICSKALAELDDGLFAYRGEARLVDGGWLFLPGQNPS
ncbi:MAG: hypothetical protein MJE77_02065 [Proteobacteria bacterium]|nr:hypothetical protein [Pseudomonadota bacterium]